MLSLRDFLDTEVGNWTQEFGGQGRLLTGYINVGVISKKIVLKTMGPHKITLK